MPSSGLSRLTVADELLVIFTFALKSFPVDRTFTKISSFNSFESTNKFIFDKIIFCFPKFSLGPTIISFLSESIFKTYKGILSETLIPFL